MSRVRQLKKYALIGMSLPGSSIRRHRLEGLDRAVQGL